MNGAVALRKIRQYIVCLNEYDVLYVVDVIFHATAPFYPSIENILLVEEFCK